MDTKQKGREFEVHKENDHPEVDQGMGGRNVVHLLHQEHQRG